MNTTNNSNTSWFAPLAAGCFCFNIFKVLSVNGKIPLYMFSVKILSAPLTFLLVIIFLNFKKIFPVFTPFWLIFVYPWIVSPSSNKLLISPSCHNFKRFSSDTKWSFEFEFLLGFQSNNTGITCIALSAIVFGNESWIQTFKRRVIDILFPSCTTRQHKKVLFPMYDLFACIIQILYHLVPEESFVIPVSVWVVVVTVVIIHCYNVSVINHSIKIDIICSVSSSEKLRCCGNLLLVLNVRWHMLLLTYCPLFWFWFCWFEATNSLELSYMTTNCLNKVFSLQFLANIQRLDE